MFNLDLRDPRNAVINYRQYISPGPNKESGGREANALHSLSSSRPGSNLRSLARCRRWAATFSLSLSLAVINLCLLVGNNRGPTSKSRRWWWRLFLLGTYHPRAHYANTIECQQTHHEQPRFSSLGLSTSQTDARASFDCFLPRVVASISTIKVVWNLIYDSKHTKTACNLI